MVKPLASPPAGQLACNPDFLFPDGPGRLLFIASTPQSKRVIELSAGESTHFRRHEIAQPAVCRILAPRLMPDHVDWQRGEFDRDSYDLQSEPLLHERTHACWHQGH